MLALLIWWRLPNQPEPAVESRTGLPWREPRAWLVSIYFALQAGLFYALATWLVARYHEVGFSLLQSNAFFSGFMLIGLPSAFIMPWLAQRFGRRHLLMACCGVLATVCLLLIAELYCVLSLTSAVILEGCKIILYLLLNPLFGDLSFCCRPVQYALFDLFEPVMQP